MRTWSISQKIGKSQMSQFSDKEVILSVFEYDFRENTSAECFNIGYGIDRNFLFGCGVSIASILLSNKKSISHFIYLLIISMRVIKPDSPIWLNNINPVSKST